MLDKIKQVLGVSEKFDKGCKNITKTLGIGAAAAIIATSGLAGLPSNVSAASSIEFTHTTTLNRLSAVASGITNCKDKRLSMDYRSAPTNRNGSRSLGDLFNPKTKYSYIDSYSSRVSLNSETPFIEPLFYFTFYTLNDYIALDNAPVDWKELEKINPALNYFDSCIFGYTSIQINPDKKAALEYPVVESGLKSICVAAFGKEKGEDIADAMLHSNIEGKRVYAGKIIEAFSRKDVSDKASTDPLSGYNQAVVANWAAYILTNHFQMKFFQEHGWEDNTYHQDSTFFEEVEFYQNELMKPLEQFAYRVNPEGHESYYLMNTFAVNEERNRLERTVSQ